MSIRHTTLLELAQKKGLEPQSTSLDAFRDRIVLRAPMSGLHEVIGQFELCQRVLDRPEVLERVSAEVVEDCYAEGTRQAELRFSPSFVCKFSSTSWADAL